MSKGGTVTALAYRSETVDGGDLLPSAVPLQLIGPDGQAGDNPGDLRLPEPSVLRELHRRMVLGRRFDTQATALTKQGRLAVYPSSRGQDACQVGAALALRDQDWLFPTYRDSVAVLTRGVPAEETLTLLRGDSDCNDVDLALVDPDAGKTGTSSGRDLVDRECLNQKLFEPAQIAMEILSAPAEIDNWIADQLPRTVIGRLAAAIGSKKRMR